MNTKNEIVQTIYNHKKGELILIDSKGNTEKYYNQEAIKILKELDHETE